MSTPLDVALGDTIRTARDDFFHSLQGDTNALSSFLKTWTSFSETIRTHKDSLQEETLIAVHALASLIGSVASNIIELEKTSDRLLQESVSDISKILDLKMGHLSLKDENNQQVTSQGNRPAYVEPSYKWLLLNLHNPYPTKEVKKKIARSTNCMIRDLDAWFVDARKRIGWNSLRKTHFSNKQDDIIAAAKHILQEDHSSFSNSSTEEASLELDPYSDVRVELVLVADKARSLYPDIFYEIQQSCPNPKSKCHNEVQAKQRATTSQNTASASYPTPQPSPDRSFEPSPPPTPVTIQLAFPTTLCDLDGSGNYGDLETRRRIDEIVALPSPANTADVLEDDAELEASYNFSPVPHVQSSLSSTTTVTSLSKRKRRLSDAGSPQPSKRLLAPSSRPLHRTEATPSSGAFQSSNATPFTPESSVLPTIALTQTRTRKRRLSEGESQRPSKRPHIALAMPRLQVVSNPLPMTDRHLDDPFDSWCSDLTNARSLSDAIPSPVIFEVPTPDDGTLEVESYQYTFSPQLGACVPGARFRTDNTSISSNHSAPDKLLLQPVSTPSFLPPTLNTSPMQEYTHTLEPRFPEIPQSLDFTQLSADYFGLIPAASQEVDFEFFAAQPNTYTLPSLFNQGYMAEPSCYGSFEPTVSSDLGFQCQVSSLIDAELEAKRARVKCLREEIRRLEGEVGSVITTN